LAPSPTATHCSKLRLCSDAIFCSSSALRAPSTIGGSASPVTTPPRNVQNVGVQFVDAELRLQHAAEERETAREIAVPVAELAQHRDQALGAVGNRNRLGHARGARIPAVP
jgi:hypothetical protein